MATSRLNIPLVDLTAQYKVVKKEMDKAIAGVIKEGRFIGGEQVEKFGIEFANVANSAYCVPCANGTDAIEIALKVLDIGKGDEVILPAFSFVATLEAVHNVGAKPVLCDIDPQRYSIRARDVEKLITKKTKAVIVVHLYGQMADMSPLVRLCKKEKLFLLEDAAQAHKAEYKGLLAGSIGQIATFSFYPGKNLGAYGDAGAITTSDEHYYQHARMIADHGRIQKYDHDIAGRNSRMDTLQAAILRVKINHLEGWIKARRERAIYYDDALAGIKQISLPRKYPDSLSVYHLYVIRVPATLRESFRNYLKKAGIETGIHYPIALSELKVTTHQLKIKASCPHAEKASRTVVSLPIYPEMTTTQQAYICDHIRDYFSYV
ncbi:MAG: DegT/DnrJ/EryC1/StrS family aminotransferase [Bacteroidota bacterium]|nr:DegT/DnrJ/EryC1/StrS family aminotransferase [Bacteroidota bacterium]